MLNFSTSRPLSVWAAQVPNRQELSGKLNEKLSESPLDMPQKRHGCDDPILQDRRNRAFYPLQTETIADCYQPKRERHSGGSPSGKKCGRALSLTAGRAVAVAFPQPRKLKPSPAATNPSGIAAADERKRCSQCLPTIWKY